MLLFNLISILRPISNFLALFQLCDYMYNLILLSAHKCKTFREAPFSAQNFTNKVLLTWWQVLGPPRLHHTASHPLTTASSHWFTFAEAEICTKVIARNTLARWRVRCFLGVLRLYPPRHILLQMSSLSRQLSREVTSFGNVKNTLEFSEPWLIKISLPDFLLTKFWTSGQPPFLHSGNCQKPVTTFEA